MKLRANIRISIRIDGKPNRKIELIRQPSGKRYWLRVDGKYSKRYEDITITELSDQLRRWLTDVGVEA